VSGAKPGALDVGDTVKMKDYPGVVGTITYLVGRHSYAVGYRLGAAHFTSTYQASELELVAKARGGAT
jgi:hypothetical protein